MTRRRRGAVLHGVAALAFGLLALMGVGAAAEGLYGLAVPFVVIGAAGGVGAAVIALTDRAATQRAARLTMAGAAAVVLLAGVVLAPRGLDRGFVITVAAVLAATLGSFALLAGERLPDREAGATSRK